MADKKKVDVKGKKAAPAAAPAADKGKKPASPKR